MRLRLKSQLVCAGLLLAKQPELHGDLCNHHEALVVRVCLGPVQAQILQDLSFVFGFEDHPLVAKDLVDGLLGHVT